MPSVLETKLSQRGDTVYYRLGSDYYSFELFDVLKAISVKLSSKNLEVPLFSDRGSAVGTVMVFGEYLTIVHREPFDKPATWSIRVIDFLTLLARHVRAEDRGVNTISIASRPPGL